MFFVEINRFYSVPSVIFILLILFSGNIISYWLFFGNQVWSLIEYLVLLWRINLFVLLTSDLLWKVCILLFNTILGQVDIFKLKKLHNGVLCDISFYSCTYYLMGKLFSSHTLGFSMKHLISIGEFWSLFCSPVENFLLNLWVGW